MAKSRILLAAACLLIPVLLQLAAVSPWRNAREDMHINTRRLAEDELNIFHEPLFPLQLNDWIGFSSATVGLVLAAGGGIGGGGILVPIFILLLNFTPKHAIALSSCCVFGGAVANTILNVPKRHPLADRPLIDWDLILVMEPPTIAGALGGVLANKALPDTAIIGMLIIVLSLTAWNTLNKAKRLYDQETLGWQKVETNDDSENDIELASKCVSNEQNCLPQPESDLLRRTQSDSCSKALKQTRHQRRKSWPPPKQEIQNLSVSDATANQRGGKSTDVVLLRCPPFFASRDKDSSSAYPTGDIPVSCAMDTSEQLFLARIIDEERHVPRRNVAIILCFFMMVLLITVLKGGGSFESPLGIQCGSASFWIAEAVVLCCILAVSLYARSYLIRMTKIKDELNYQYVDGDIRWDERATCVYPSASIVAGFFAGMFGVGGGIVKGPLMLAMGVLPAVASATAACMILFTSFTATASFIVFGLMITDYAWFCFGMGFFATVLGQVVMSHLLRTSGRNSYIAFSIGIVVLLSAVFMTVESVLASRDTSFHSPTGLCSAH